MRRTPPRQARRAAETARNSDVPACSDFFFGRGVVSIASLQAFLSCIAYNFFYLAWQCAINGFASCQCDIPMADICFPWMYYLNRFAFMTYSGHAACGCAHADLTCRRNATHAAQRSRALKSTPDTKRYSADLEP